MFNQRWKVFFPRLKSFLPPSLPPKKTNLFFINLRPQVIERMKTNQSQNQKTLHGPHLFSQKVNRQILGFKILPLHLLKWSWHDFEKLYTIQIEFKSSQNWKGRRLLHFIWYKNLCWRNFDYFKISDWFILPHGVKVWQSSVSKSFHSSIIRMFFQSPSDYLSNHSTWSIYNQLWFKVLLTLRKEKIFLG